MSTSKVFNLTRNALTGRALLHALALPPRDKSRHISNLNPLPQKHQKQPSAQAGGFLGSVFLQILHKFSRVDISSRRAAIIFIYFFYYLQQRYIKVTKFWFY
jgi:hypothetical protein